MAMSSCPKCGNHLFEVQTTTPSQSNYKLLYVQCSSCGAVIGVMDYYNIGARIDKQDAALKKIARALNISVDL